MDAKQGDSLELRFILRFNSFFFARIRYQQLAAAHIILNLQEWLAVTKNTKTRHCTIIFNDFIQHHDIFSFFFEEIVQELLNKGQFNSRVELDIESTWQ